MNIALHIQKNILLFICLLGASITNAQQIFYATPTGTGDGSTWATASGDLQELIDLSSNGDQIWVAEGEYQPRVGTAFSMREGVGIYGGFKGDEITFTQRNWKTNITKLKGNGTNVILNQWNELTETSILDGFSITGGNNAYGAGISNITSSPTFRNLIIYDNHATGGDGGGIYNINSTSQFINLDIRANSANRGAAIYEQSASSLFINCNISGNSAEVNGGGIYEDDSQSKFVNITVVGNTKEGFLNAWGYPEIYNSIISGNEDITEVDNFFTVRNSLVQGNKEDLDHYNLDGDLDPLFVDAKRYTIAPTITGDYQLKKGSILINRGDNQYFDLSKTTVSLDGLQRIREDIIDLGAYESNYKQVSADQNGIIYVSTNGAGDFTGNSWTNALPYLQSAINLSGVKQVWVAAGQYQPASGKSFVMKDKIKIYGGFAGDESELGQRNWQTNVTILKGNGANVIYNNNNELTNEAVLAGFTITGGKAAMDKSSGGGIYNFNVSPCFYDLIVNNNQANEFGGGIYNQESSPIFVNITVKDNTAGIDGGGIYNQEGYFTLNQIFVINNTALNIGGGIINRLGAIGIINSVIEGNRAISGGGISSIDSHTAITNTAIRGNVADKNETPNYSSVGGGIENTDSPLILINVLISGNYAGFDGGGINTDGNSDFILTNVTIAGNKTSATRNGAINCPSNFAPDIRNSIIWGNTSNTPGRVYFQTTKTKNSLIQYLTNTNMGNIYTNPKFMNELDFGTAPFIGGDYRLSTNSPAINTGSNTFFNVGKTPDLSNITTDLAGTNRFNGTVDMGAYEYLAVLPLELLAFNAKAEQHAVRLEWKTTAERNVREFIISRSQDAKSFIEIDRIKANSESLSEINTYVRKDHSPTLGLNYYLLSQVNSDGNTEKLAIQTVKFGIGDNELRIYPNPVEKEVSVNFDAGQYHTIELLDLTGKSLQKFGISVNNSSATLNLAQLPTGTYIIMLKGDSESIIKKILKR